MFLFDNLFINFIIVYYNNYDRLEKTVYHDIVHWDGKMSFSKIVKGQYISSLDAKERLVDSLNWRKQL